MNCIGSDNTIAYDRNSLIKKNFAYFYDSFTTAIYKTSFIKNNNILFPININYFEDPYFSILACLKYKKVAIVDSANYYYVNRLNSLVNSVGSLELTNGISAMLEMSKILNKETIIKENYTILYTYIISQLTLVLSNIKCSQQVADKANEYLFEVISECKYKKECLANYFEMKRFIRKKSYTNILKKKIQRG